VPDSSSNASSLLCFPCFDVPFLLLALVGQVIRGDKDLLELEQSCSCPIVVLEQFLLDLKI
jgi:hypothetical protein